MGRLPKHTLSYNRTSKKWDLKKDKSREVVQSFKKKENATKRGVLKKAVGKNGGSVKIKNKDGEFQEERTYPRSKDPKKSKG
jgi:hypothetical protein